MRYPSERPLGNDSKDEVVGCRSLLDDDDGGDDDDESVLIQGQATADRH